MHTLKYNPKDHSVTITLKLGKIAKSASGKSSVIYSTHGNVGEVLENWKGGGTALPISLGINIYTKADVK